MIIPSCSHFHYSIEACLQCFFLRHQKLLRVIPCCCDDAFSFHCLSFRSFFQPFTSYIFSPSSSQFVISSLCLFHSLFLTICLQQSISLYLPISLSFLLYCNLVCSLFCKGCCFLCFSSSFPFPSIFVSFSLSYLSLFLFNLCQFSTLSSYDISAFMPIYDSLSLSSLSLPSFIQSTYLLTFSFS